MVASNAVMIAGTRVMCILMIVGGIFRRTRGPGHWVPTGRRRAAGGIVPSRRWVRTIHHVPLDVTTTIVREEDVSAARRAAAFLMFPEYWQSIPGNEPGRAWTQMRPSWRVIAEDAAGTLVGQVGLVRVVEGAQVLGVSDVVVSESWRERGVSALMLAEVCDFADKDGFGLMVDTKNPGLRRVLARLGFSPITTEASLEAGGERVLPPNWMGRGLSGDLVLASNF